MFVGRHRPGLRTACLGILLITPLFAGCGERALDVGAQEQGNTAVSLIRDQATRLESQQAELTALANSAADHAQLLHEAADDLEQQAQDMRFRADELEAQAAGLRDLVDEHSRTVSGLRNATTTMMAIMNNEPIQPLALERSGRGEYLLYAALALVLLLLLYRLRRSRIERVEEERLTAIRRQQAAYSPVTPDTGDADAGTESTAGESAAKD